MNKKKFNSNRVFILVSVLVGFFCFLTLGGQNGYGDWSWLLLLLLSLLVAPMLTFMGLGILVVLMEHFLEPIWQWLHSEKKSREEKVQE